MSFTPEQLKENRAKWVKALRSGKYKQGDTVLFNRKEKSYCCLGVLCVTAGLKPVKTKIDKETVDMFEGTWAVAPPRAMDFVGLVSAGGAFQDVSKAYGQDFTNALWQLNDIAKLSFEEIADIIEAEPKGLFK